MRSRAGFNELGVERICLAFDVKHDAAGTPMLRTRGWRQDAGCSLWDAVDRYTSAGLRHVLCTDIERDGALGGANVELYRAAVRRYPALQWQASGGIATHRRSARTQVGRCCRNDQRHGPARKSTATRGIAAILARRIIPCLDVRDGQVVKGVRFRDHRVVGGIVELARRYRDEGADELVFYDITASPEQRSVDRGWVGAVARELDIPFCVAGGIGSVAEAEAVLAAGADKISVNSPALRRPQLIDELAHRFGSQCVVVGIDSLSERRPVSRAAVHRRCAAQSRQRPRHIRAGSRKRSSAAPARSCSTA